MSKWLKLWVSAQVLSFYIIPYLCHFSAKETHQIAEATAEKNAKLKEAFGISEYYQDGSSFDPNRKAKEEAAKALAMAQKKYA